MSDKQSREGSAQSSALKRAARDARVAKTKRLLSDGLTTSEIAERLGMPLRTTSQLVWRINKGDYND